MIARVAQLVRALPRHGRGPWFDSRRAHNMKIAIASDSHDNFSNLKKVVDEANKLECEVFLFAGDLNAPTGLLVLKEFNGEVHMVWGNNEGEREGITQRLKNIDNITLHGDEFEETLGGVRVFMTHYPDTAESTWEAGEYDLCIYGHTHKYRFKEREGAKLINPGAVCGYQDTGDEIKDISSIYIIFDTETKLVEKNEIKNT